MKRKQLRFEVGFPALGDEYHVAATFEFMHDAEDFKKALEKQGFRKVSIRDEKWAKINADIRAEVIDQLDRASDKPTFDKSLYGVQSKLGIGTVGKNTIAKMEKSKGAKKYTLQECFDSNIAIHCDTEDKANRLCKAMDKKGWTWGSGTRYTDINRWGHYREETCYRPSAGTYADVSWYKKTGQTVFEFDDVDLGD